MKVLLAVATMTMCVAAMSLTERVSKTSELSKRRYCGNVLSTTLNMICSGFYNTVSLNVVTPGSMTATEHARPRRRAHTFMPRNKRGIYDECCAQSCSIDELSSYCGQSPKWPGSSPLDTIHLTYPDIEHALLAKWTLISILELPQL